MAQTDPNAVAQRWATNLGQAVPKIQASVQAMTQSPGQAASASADKWQQAVSSPTAKQRFQQKTSALSLATWQQDFLNKGLPRISTGAQTAIPKMASFMNSFLPYVNSVAARVRAMPKNTLQDSIARATSQIQGNAAYKQQQH